MISAFTEIFAPAFSPEERQLKQLGALSSRDTTPSVAATEVLEVAVAKRINKEFGTDFTIYESANEEGFDLKASKPHPALGDRIQVKSNSKNSEGYHNWPCPSDKDSWREVLHDALKIRSNSSSATTTRTARTSNEVHLHLRPFTIAP